MPSIKILEEVEFLTSALPVSNDKDLKHLPILAYIRRKDGKAYASDGKRVHAWTPAEKKDVGDAFLAPGEPGRVVVVQPDEKEAAMWPDSILASFEAPAIASAYVEVGRLWDLLAAFKNVGERVLLRFEEKTVMVSVLLHSYTGSGVMTATIPLCPRDPTYDATTIFPGPSQPFEFAMEIRYLRDILAQPKGGQTHSSPYVIFDWLGKTDPNRPDASLPVRIRQRANTGRAAIIMPYRVESRAGWGPLTNTPIGR